MSRTDDVTYIRLPPELKQTLQALAGDARRSFTAELVQRLQGSLAGEVSASGVTGHASATRTTAPTANIAPFGLRMLPGLREQIEAAARESGRSMNAEVVARLEQTFGSQPAAPRLFVMMELPACSLGEASE